MSTHEQQQRTLLFALAVGLLTIVIGHLLAFEQSVGDYVVIAAGIAIAWAALYYQVRHLDDWN